MRNNKFKNPNKDFNQKILIKKSKIFQFRRKLINLNYLKKPKKYLFQIKINFNLKIGENNSFLDSVDLK